MLLGGWAALGGRAASEKRGGFYLESGASCALRRWTGWAGAEGNGDRVGLVEPDFACFGASCGTGSPSGRSGVGAARAVVPRDCSGSEPEELAEISTAEWIRRSLRSERARASAAALVRVTTFVADQESLSADVAATQLKIGLLPGVRYLRGGWQSLVDALAAKAEADGRAAADPRRGARPRTAAADGWEVTLDGETLRADVVVVAAGGPEAVAKLLGERTPAAPGPAAEISVLDLGLRSLPRRVAALRARRRPADLPLAALAAGAPRRRPPQPRQLRARTAGGAGGGGRRRPAGLARAGDAGALPAADGRRLGDLHPGRRRPRRAARRSTAARASISPATGSAPRGGWSTPRSPAAPPRPRPPCASQVPAAGMNGDAFAACRPRLLGIAYGLLGELTEAEDVVQDAWLRWEQADGDAVRNPEAFLVTVTTRLALDRLRSARARREVYVGPWLPEPLLTDPDDAGDEGDRGRAARPRPAGRAGAAESGRARRPRPPRRLRPRVRGDRRHPRAAPRPTSARSPSAPATTPATPAARRAVSEEERQRLADAFLLASLSGDVEQIRDLLAADAIMYSDGGGVVTAARKPIYGADKIARFIVGVQRKAAFPADPVFTPVLRQRRSRRADGQCRATASSASSRSRSPTARSRRSASSRTRSVFQLSSRAPDPNA